MESRQRVDRLLVVLLALSLIVNVGVVWWFVKGRVDPATPKGPDVAVGSTLAPISGVTKDGQPLTVSYAEDAKPVVLYVFSPACVWCERNLESIATLSRLAGAKFRFVGVSLPSAATERQSPFEFPVVFAVGRLPFRATPQTVVVGRDGRVLQSWMGAYVGKTKEEMEKYFGTSLPGLEARANGG